MAARTSRKAIPAAKPADAALPSDRIADFGRQQLTVVTEGGATLLRGLDAMRRIQEQAVQQVMHRHASAAGRFNASAPAADLLALQAELLQNDFADTLRCWQALVGEAVEINTELLGCAARLVNTEDVFAATRFLHD